MLDRFVLHNARRCGDVVALGGLVRQCRFDQLEASVSRLARALEGLRELAPRLVAVQCVDSWRHWMLLLVLSRLGVASVSLPDADVPQEMLAVLSPDLIILHNGDLPAQEGRLSLDDGWFRAVLDGVGDDHSEDYYPPVPVASDALCRVAVAMGTDRDMHVLGFSYADVEASLLRLVYQDMGEALALMASDGQKPHLLCTISPVSMSGFLMVGAALVAGTTVRIASEQTMGAEVAQGHALFVVLTPVHLDYLLRSLPPGMKRVSHLHLTVVGAALSPLLLERAQSRLTPHISVAYGIDECGVLSSIDALKREGPQSVGRVLPWAGVQIVDAEENPLPAGEKGVIRVRATGAVTQYLNEPDVTQKRFRDGWFYPGDRGFISAIGELHLCGRVDDLVAIGGGKFDLHLIDQMVKEESVVQDAASFVRWSKDGQQALYCALITTGELDGEALSKRLRQRYSALPPVTVIWVRELPYTEAGQVDRERLAQSLSVHLERQ